MTSATSSVCEHLFELFGLRAGARIRLQPVDPAAGLLGEPLDDVAVGREVVGVGDDRAAPGACRERGGRQLVEADRGGVGDQRRAGCGAEEVSARAGRRHFAGAPSRSRSSCGSAARSTRVSAHVRVRVGFVAAGVRANCRRGRSARRGSVRSGPGTAPADRRRRVAQRGVGRVSQLVVVSVMHGFGTRQTGDIQHKHGPRERTRSADRPARATTPTCRRSAATLPIRLTRRPSRASPRVSRWRSRASHRMSRGTGVTCPNLRRPRRAAPVEPSAARVEAARRRRRPCCRRVRTGAYSSARSSA